MVGISPLAPTGQLTRGALNRGLGRSGWFRQTAPYSLEFEPDVLIEPQPRHRTPSAWMIRCTRWQHSIAIGSSITLHWVAELIVFAPDFVSSDWKRLSEWDGARLAFRGLPASAIVRQVAVDIYDPDSPGQPATAKPQLLLGSERFACHAFGSRERGLLVLGQRTDARTAGRNCAARSSNVVVPNATAAVPPVRMTSTSVIPTKARMRLR
jgi:hypothetical protein